MTSGISRSPRVGSFSWSCSKCGRRPPAQRIVELPGCPGNTSTGVRETFSRAAVVIVEDVLVLIPFMTRSWATSGLLVVEGLRAFTTSFTALAWLSWRIIFLIGFAHRGSTVRGEDSAPPKGHLKRTTKFALAFRAPPRKECVSLIRIGSMYEMAVRGNG